MPGGKSTYFANLILNFAYGGQAIESAIPATLYFALMTVAPTDAGGGTECVVSGISRVAKTRNNTNFPAPSAKLVSNATGLSFGTPATGVTCPAVAVYDASSGGNLIDWFVFDTAAVLTAGVPYELPIGGLRRSEV
jgi:hypothetical protein